MTRLNIYEVPGHPPDDLVAWGEFFRFEVFVFKTGDWDVNTLGMSNWGDRPINITSDLFPRFSILRNVFDDTDYSTNLTLVYRDRKWVPSVCFITDKLYTTGEFLDDPITDLKPMGDRVGTEKADVFDVIAKGSSPRRSILWIIILQEWYNGGKDVCEKILYPMLMEANHHAYLNGETVQIDTLRQQILFYPPLVTIDVPNVVSFPEFKEIVRKDKITIKRCLKGLVRHRYNVDISGTEFTSHPLSYTGLFEAVPVAPNPEIDLSITIVTFFYDLGLIDRSKDVYLASLQKIAKLRYPIVIYGTLETLTLFTQLRGDLNVYTEYITRPLNDWEIYNTYCVTENEDSREKSTNYRLLTNLKFYAVSEAINKRPFVSSSYVWLDAGIYKYDHPVSFSEELYPFKNVKVENKIIVQSLWQAGGTTNDEYNSEVSSIIAMTFITPEKVWRRYFPLLDAFIRSKFDGGQIQSEQNVWARVDMLYPGYLERRQYSYDKTSLSSFLSLSHPNDLSLSGREVW